MDEFGCRRLEADQLAAARRLFAMMWEAFAEAAPALGDAYLARLLAGEDFWVFAVFRGEEPVGGVTAHVLPLVEPAGRGAMERSVFAAVYIRQEPTRTLPCADATF